MDELVAQTEDRGWFYNWVLERVGGNEFVATVLGTVIPDLLRLVAIFGIAWLANSLVRRFIKRLVERMVHEEGGPFPSIRRAGTDSRPISPQRAIMRTETVGAVLRSVSSLLIWSIAILVAVGSLTTVDINLGPHIASAGIVGVALGFGAQSLVKDFLSGVFMLMEDQYGIGDIITLGDATGTVERISLRKTQIRDLEGTVWHIPNGEITRVGNLSQLWSRTLLDVGVAYDTDLRAAMATMKDTADGMAADPAWAAMILEPPEIWGVQQFADSSIAIRMVIKTEPAQQWAVNRELRLRLKEAFDRNGIEIPFPQRTMWYRGDGPGAPDGTEGGVDRGARDGNHGGSEPPPRVEA